MKKISDLLGDVLIKYPQISLCIVFGSVAEGKDSSGSDLDIAVAGAGPLSEDEYLDLNDAFASATGRETDLIDLTTATGLILKQVLSKGVIVQNKDKDLYARLISRMLFNQADMMPYHDRILRERRERFLNG